MHAGTAPFGIGIALVQLLLGMCLLGFAFYTALAIYAAFRWRSSRKPYDPDWAPAVTILKPVRGSDAEAYENFASFCRLDYPLNRLQIVFGALEADDPALHLAARLQQDFPHIPITVTTAPPGAARGNNRKVCNLIAMLPHAQNDLLVLCDSDMRVEPDYLRRIVAPFQRNSPLMPLSPLLPKNALAAEKTGSNREAERPVGMVTCPYRGIRALSPAAVLEALGIGTDFIPSALVSRALEGVRFALGSTIVLPRAVLQQIGGFEPLIDELADDYRLGIGVYQSGYRIEMSDYVIADVLGRERLGAMWARRLRWARTLRVCRPAGYGGAFITHGTALALVFALSTGLRPIGLAALASALFVRYSASLLIVGLCTGDRTALRWLPLLPFSDLLNTVLYLVSFCGSHVVWRGERFRLLPGGRLVRD